MPVGLPAGKRMLLFSSLILALVLISILYIYYSQRHSDSEEERNTGSMASSTSSVGYRNASSYIHLFNQIPPNIIEEIKVLEPWVSLSCKYCNNGSLQVTLGELYYKLNSTIERLVGRCKNTLWEEYVLFLAYSYWLGVDGMIKRSEKYLQKGNTAASSHYARVAYSYIELLEELNSSQAKTMFCQIPREQAREETFKIYRELKRKLLGKYSVIKEMIDKINTSSTKYRLVASVIAHKISRELEESSSIITNESIFTYILHRNSIEALDTIVNVYFIVSLYLEVIMNMSYINNLDRYFSNYSYVKEVHDTIVNKLEALASKEIDDPEKLIIRHILLRVIALHFHTIAWYVSGTFNENNYINETSLFTAFLEDGNFALRVIEFLAMPQVIDEITEVVLEE